MKRTLHLSLAVLLIGLLTFGTSVQAASKSYEETVSADDLAIAYQEASFGGAKVRILIMPGHEPMYGGAEFMGYYEREFVVDIAERLKRELETDPNFEVSVARDGLGWNDDLAPYFDRQMRKITRFVEDHKEDYEKLVKRGRIDVFEEQASHNAAPGDVATRLYGVSKWANENGIDLVIHLHLNDETGHGSNERGAYSGAAIYVPDAIYGNADASRAIAEPVLERLKSTSAVSNFGYETKGIVEDRELIAVGAYNTSEAPSLLLEYGYIYEPRITGDGARDSVFADFAFQTAQGVKDFFGSPGRPRFDTKALPYTFSSDLLATSTATSTNATGIYALQALLRDLDLYPGSEASLGVCPISGLTNECTTLAVKAFQARNNLEQTGTLGPRTRAALNAAQGVAAAAPAPSVPVTPAPACAAFTSELSLDATDADTNGEVTRLQTILAKDTQIYPEGLITGFYGPATDRAVKRFQLKEAIVTASSSAYGLVGPATKAKLLAWCSTAGN
ncbi:MAG TPA: peptidoglycan-binding protein [Candidatus Paceibacterota bacterium]